MHQCSLPPALSDGPTRGQSDGIPKAAAGRAKFGAKLRKSPANSQLAKSRLCAATDLAMMQHIRDPKAWGPRHSGKSHGGAAMQAWQQFLEHKLNQEQHDRLVLYLASWLAENDFVVRAGHGLPGFLATKEFPKSKRVPDIFAILPSGGVVIGEAETVRGLNDPDTSKQMQDLQAEADRLRARFYIIVPQSALELANQKVAEWKVSPEILSVPDHLLPPV